MSGANGVANAGPCGLCAYRRANSLPGLCPDCTRAALAAAVKRDDEINAAARASLEADQHLAPPRTQRLIVPAPIVPAPVLAMSPREGTVEKVARAVIVLEGLGKDLTAEIASYGREIDALRGQLARVQREHADELAASSSYASRSSAYALIKRAIDVGKLPAGVEELLDQALAALEGP